MLNKWIVRLLDFLPRDLVWVFSKRYIAGQELNDAVKVTQKLNSQKIKATMDLLGEFQTNEGKVKYYKEEYFEAYRNICRKRTG